MKEVLNTPFSEKFPAHVNRIDQYKLNYDLKIFCLYLHIITTAQYIKVKTNYITKCQT